LQKIEDDAVEAKRMAEHARFNNNKFDKRATNENFNRKKEILVTKDSHLAAAHEKKLREEIEGAFERNYGILGSNGYPSISQHTKEEAKLVKKSKQAEQMRGLDEQVEKKRKIQHAIDFFSSGGFSQSTDKPILSQKEMEVSRVNNYLVGNAGVFVSQSNNPYDRSAANIGTLPRKQTIELLKLKRKSNDQMINDWDKSKQIHSIKDKL
jgi:hypothetical protein